VESSKQSSNFGKWMALVAAILGWLFDGFEMGLFPLVMKPLLKDLLAGSSASEEIWEGIMHAGFLIGAATGGVLFGWLGDRMGRVRAMSLSVLTYAIFSGLCGLGTSAEMVLLFRFIASLGMGGEWSLGVSLVMEIWPGKSRAWLAGLIGAASNVGFMLVAIISLVMNDFIASIESAMLAINIPQSTVDRLTDHSAWRLLMLIGAVPALLTFFIRIFVPESERWVEEKEKGTTRHWEAKDLIGLALGCLGPMTMVLAYALGWPAPVQIAAVIFGLGAALVGFTHPVRLYLRRGGADQLSITPKETLRRMYLGALLSGIALLATWGSVQRGASFANDVRKAEFLQERQTDEKSLSDGVRAEMNVQLTKARAWTQITSAIGAILGTILGALLAERIGRRVTYCILCLAGFLATVWFFLGTGQYGPGFLIASTALGMATASFYGWLPLYLPELFPTRLRAIGQGFSFNFGRILAGAGSLYLGLLIRSFGGKYPIPCTLLTTIYFVGVAVIWLAPETKGKPLPE
jgi:SHS family sialic acid transporter-like MFS transporter